MRCLSFLAATAALLAPTTILAATEAKVEFVRGTVKSIPANTAGSLNAASSAELSFHYGKSVFSVPYQNIINTEVTEPTGRHLLKVPVPKLGKGVRYLNIAFTQDGVSRMLTFKAPAGTVNSLLTTINDHRKDPSLATASTPAPAVAAASTKKAPKTKKSLLAKKQPKEKTPEPEKTASAQKTDLKTDTESWWGDRYWRTTRNQGKWPQTTADNTAGVPSGTKE